MRKSVLFLVLMLVAASTPSLAADNGFYLGLGVGRGSLTPSKFYDDQGQSVVEEPSAYKLYGGYRFFNYLGVEAGYMDLGSTQAMEKMVMGHPKTLDVAVEGWGAFAVGYLPIKRVDLFAKIGIVSWDTEVWASQDAEEIYRDAQSGSDLAWGVGLNIELGRLVSLRGEYEQFAIGDVDDASMFTIGVLFRL